MTITPEWTNNLDKPLRCVGGPKLCRGELLRCHSWAHDFMFVNGRGRHSTVRYVRAVRLNRRRKTMTFYLAYFGTLMHGTSTSRRRAFDARSRKAAA